MHCYKDSLYKGITALSTFKRPSWTRRNPSEAISLVKNHSRWMSEAQEEAKRSTAAMVMDGPHATSPLAPKVWRCVREQFINQRDGHHNQPSETRCQSDNTATDPGLGTTLSPPACHLLLSSLTPARCIKAFLFARKTPHPLCAFSDSFLAAGVGLLLLGPHSH